MAEDSNSKDKALQALDFIIQVLREHEQNLDKSIDELATVTEQIGDTEALNCKLGKVEEKITNLQKEVTYLIDYLSTGLKAPPIAAKNQDPQAQETSGMSPTRVQGKPSLVLRCSQWEDFQALAMNAQTLFFNYKEDEKVFQANALSGNQLIAYAGAFPNFTRVLIKWLSLKLGIAEQNIFEGSLDKLE
jgi:hypothetical protein